MKVFLTVALVTGALLLSHLSVPASATNYDAAGELHRSMARYRQFFEHEETMALMRNLLQVNQKIKDELGSTAEGNSIDPDPGKDAEESQRGPDAVEKREPVEANSTDNPTDEKSIEQQQIGEKIKEDSDMTDENPKDKFQMEQDGIETQVSVEDDSNENPNHDSEKQQQQVVEKTEENRDRAGKEIFIDNDPEKQVDHLQLGQDVVEKNVPTEENPKEDPKLEISEDQRKVLDQKSHDGEDQLGQDVKDGEKQSEENVNEHQEEKPDAQEKIFDSEEHVKEVQPGQSSVEIREPAEENLLENRTNEKAKVLLQDEKNMNGNKQETVEGEIVDEKSNEEDSHQNPKIDQHQQEGSDKNGELEQKETEEQQQQQEEEEEEEEERNEGEGGNNTEKKEPFVFPEPYLLGPPIDDWDEQRANWLEQNPHMKSADGKPKVLIVTGSQPGPCRSFTGDYFHIQSLKLKMDYARMHNYEVYYSFAWLDSLFGGYWVKLPIIRKLMLTHPEIEWFFWVDSDAVFTDMLFEPPFHTYENYNMVMWGWNYGVYTQKSWTAFNAGVFIIRNCQWSLDLIDKWSPMGPDGPVRDQYGKVLSAFLTGRDNYHGGNYPADDQSALVYLMITDDAVKSKVKLVEHAEYMISGWWVDTVPLYNASMEKYHPGLGDYRWPFITHFTGCSPCGGDQGSDDYTKCMEAFEIAFNFADNQVLAYMGFQHKSLSSPAVIRIRNETDRPLEFLGVNPWEERIAQVAAAGISGPS